MTAWAAENLDSTLVEAFDNVIESGDVATINLMLEGSSITIQGQRGLRKQHDSR